MGEKSKDSWDRAAIVLQPVGGLLTALSVALLGILGSRSLSQQQTISSESLSRQQAIEQDTRVYTELMSNREQADTALRKDMFKSIMDTFLKGRSDGLEQEVLELELLAYNFHESLNLGPLFKHVVRKINRESPDGKRFQARVERIAKDVSNKQVEILTDAGASLPVHLGFAELSKHPDGLRLMDEYLELRTTGEGEADSSVRRFRLDVFDVDMLNRTLRIWLRVDRPGRTSDQPDVDTGFSVGFFDLPMIDNTRLTRGQRCAVVLRKFEKESAEITVIYFPGSRAGLKEKPYYEDILDELRRRRAFEN